MAEALVSIKRIQKYMMYEETEVRDKSMDLEAAAFPGSNQSTVINEENKLMEEENDKLFNANSHATLSEAGIIISNLRAKWDEQQTEYTLDDVNLRVQPGTLVAIIGPVGAGKSR